MHEGSKEKEKELSKATVMQQLVSSTRVSQKTGIIKYYKSCLKILDLTINSQTNLSSVVNFHKDILKKNVIFLSREIELFQAHVTQVLSVSGNKTLHSYRYISKYILGVTTL